MADTIIKLGDFEFAHAEVPESINIGGNQQLGLNKFVGGRRSINAMGRDDDDISWHGIFYGSNASKRAQALDYLRTQGNQLTFTYLNFKYSVVIKHFSADIQKYYVVPYRLTLCIVEDLSNPVIIPPPAGFLDALFDDLSTLFDILSLVTHPNIGIVLEELSAYLHTLLPNDAITADVRGTIDGLIRNVADEIGKDINALAGAL